MRDKAFAKELKERSLRGEAALRAMKEHLGENTEAFGEALCQYISLRYLLNRVPRREENLYALAEESVGNMLKANKDVLLAMERESGCTGATSGMMKKVLLLLSVKKALSLSVTEEAVTAVETIDNLIRLCEASKTTNPVGAKISTGDIQTIKEGGE